VVAKICRDLGIPYSAQHGSTVARAIVENAPDWREEVLTAFGRRDQRQRGRRHPGVPGSAGRAKHTAATVNMAFSRWTGGALNRGPRKRKRGESGQAADVSDFVLHAEIDELRPWLKAGHR
jgi:hypothetical protein